MKRRSAFSLILYVLILAVAFGWIMGLFDRLFIDWFWVEHTKAWIIPGTEDLMPYIPVKTKIGKWLGTVIGFPMMAALIAGVASFLG